MRRADEKQASHGRKLDRDHSRFLPARCSICQYFPPTVLMKVADWVGQCTLTHLCNNAFADSSTSKVGPVHGGLSLLGRSAVKEMDRIGEHSTPL